MELDKVNRLLVDVNVELLHSLVEEYIEEYKWFVDFRESPIGSGAYTFEIIKEEKNGGNNG